MANAKTQKYIVTRAGISRGTGSEKDPMTFPEVNDELSLTEKQAEGLVGKIRPKGEAPPVNADLEKAEKQASDRATENNTLTAKNNELADQVKKLTDQLTKAAPTKADLEKSKKLATENKQLTDQVKKLTDQLTKAAPKPVAPAS